MWRYRVDDNQVIDADTGKALTLEEVTKLLNAVPSVKEEFEEALDLVDEALDLVDEALDKLKDVDTPNSIKGEAIDILVNEAINLLEQASNLLDIFG